MFPFEFEETDILWEIVRKYGMTPNDVRTAVLAWAYTLARVKERDETCEKLNDAYKSYHREMTNVNQKKMKEIYHL